MDESTQPFDLEKSGFNISTKVASILSTPGGGGSTGRPSLRSLAMTPDQVSSQNTSHLTKTFNASESLIIGDEDFPGKTVQDGLFEAFACSLDSCSSAHHLQIFDMVSEWEQSCSNTLHFLSSLRPILGKHRRAYTMWDMEKQIRGELQTWRLLLSFLQDVVVTSPMSDGNTSLEPMDMMADILGKNLSDKEIVDELFNHDPETRQYQVLVDWSERNAMEETEDMLVERVEFFQAKGVSWENTLHTLKCKAQRMGKEYNRPLVTEIDFDAPRRQQLPLHDIDQNDELRLLRHIFSLIRCGQLEEAQHVCVRVGHFVKAASLEGWRPFVDPNNAAKTSTLRSKLPMLGNKHRDIWKLSSWNMSNDSNCHILDRAITGSQCGNLKALSSACETWSDFVWAAFKTAVDVRVEQAIRLHCARPTHVDMPQEYYRQELNAKGIFDWIESINKPPIQEQANEPVHIVQKLLILQFLDELTDELATWSENADPHSLRFYSHLLLFLKRVGFQLPVNSYQAVIFAYVKALIFIDNGGLVAQYAALLPAKAQIDLYSAYLQTIQDKSDQIKKAALEMAYKMRLPVIEIAKTVVENARHQTPVCMESELCPETTEDDILKIKSLDWLTYDPDHKAELLWQANAVMRLFLAARKMDALKQAFTKVPTDAVNVLMEHHETLDNFPPVQANTLKEYLCLQVYLDGMHSFDEWFNYCHKRKPIPPVKLSSGATFQETVAHEHRLKVYTQDKERWSSNMKMYTTAARDRLYNILLFPNGGWMVDAEESGDSLEEIQRVQQMKGLRRICIPQLTMLLFTVFQEMGELDQCLKLCNEVMAAPTQIYTVFSEECLEEFLGRIKDVLVELLDKKEEPWRIN